MVHEKPTEMSYLHKRAIKTDAFGPMDMSQRGKEEWMCSDWEVGGEGPRADGAVDSEGLGTSIVWELVPLS